MSRSSGSTAVGTIIILIGVSLLVSGVSGAGSSTVLPGMILVWVGLSVRARAKKQNARPQVPEGFAPANSRQVGEQRPPESPDAEQEVVAAVGDDQGHPLPVPTPSDRPSSAGGYSANPPPVAPAAQEVSVPQQVRIQVVELANAGRTVEAIEVLREATGMELYEASQYVRRARSSATAE